MADVVHKPVASKAGEGALAFSRPSRLPRLLMVEIAVFLALAVMPLFLEFFWVVFLTKVMILGMVALSFDLNWGYSGIMSFGQALFFGTSAYVVGLLGRDMDLAQGLITLPLGALVGMTLALLMAMFLLLGKRAPTVIFVSLGTLTGSYAAERLAAAWYYIGGANGLSGIPVLMLGPVEFFEGPEFYYLAFALLAVVYLGCRFFVRSQFGLVLAGMREQERRLAFFGYRVQLFKAIVFSLSGLIAGLAGALYAYHEGFAGPRILGINLSTMIVLYALLGGSGTLIGAIVGCAMIEVGSLFLADQPVIRDFWPVILGVLMLLVILLKPTGILGLFVPDRERIGSFRRESGTGGAP